MTENNLTTRICKVAGCDKPIDRVGWCSMHYSRWKRNGDPLVIKKRWTRPQPAPQGFKVCAACGQTKPTSEFWVQRSRRDGLNDRCSPCARGRAHQLRPLRQPREYGLVKTEDAIYLAGFFDGEGSVVIYERGLDANRRTMPFQLRLHLSSTHRGVMEWLQESFGGCFYVDTSCRDNKAISYKWSSSSGHAAHLLQAMLPYLKIKKPEAELALEFQGRVEAAKHRPHPNRRGSAALDEQEVAWRRDAAGRLRELKRSYKDYA